MARRLERAAAGWPFEGGPDKLKDIKDPFGTGPFEYRALGDSIGNGFELKSKLLHDGKPVALTAGQRKKE